MWSMVSKADVRSRATSTVLSHSLGQLSPVMMMCTMQLSTVVVEHPFRKLCVGGLPEVGVPGDGG